MKELLESLQEIDNLIDDSRYLLTLNINDTTETVYKNLNTVSKIIKKITSDICS